MEPTAKKKTHRVRNALLGILIFLLLAIGILAFVFKDYLRQLPSLYKGLTYSSEGISSMQAENDKKTNELLGELAVETMRDLTEDERALLASGELSKSDAIALIQGFMTQTDIGEETTADTSVDEPVTTAETEVTTSTSTTAETTTTAATTSATSASTAVSGKAPAEPLINEEKQALQNRVSEIIAEIYLLRATYLNKIDELIATSKAEYVALPKEQHNLQGKMRFIEKSLVPKGNALEAECDAEMQTLLTELKGILTQLGSDTGIISEIETAYKEQKELKMAELYNKYSSKLK